MHVRFLSDGSEYRSYGGGSVSKKKEGGGIFWWSILITLLMGAATFCWFFSIMVFSHPEKPFNYKMLAKFKKLEMLRPFTVYTAPHGKFLGARDLLTEFFPYSQDQMAVRNDVLKRSYIRNYKHEQPTYLKGDFNVISSRRLTPADVMGQGWVVRARAADIEDVDVEILMPGLVSEAEPYAVGATIKLDQKQTFASTLHVQRMEADRLCVSVIPLAYQGFVSNAGGVIRMTPPEALNMDAYWPVTRDPGLVAAGEETA
ncbi:MAG: hypothetical protein U0984_03760, partial [Prosthecobacter sp.]|nr:hypothetical protein [Prosthecobacter sp.]